MLDIIFTEYSIDIVNQLNNFILIGGFGDDTPKHDNVPNMKLVMNPEGIQQLNL